MKKIITILLTLIMVLSIVACSQDISKQEEPTVHEQLENEEETNGVEETPQPQLEIPDTESIAPVELLSEEYNLFYDVEFPESYTVYAAEYVDAREFKLFYINLATMDGQEDVVTFVSNLLGDTAEQSVQQNLDYLTKDGFVEIKGTEVDAGLFADCEITLIKDEDDFDGFTGGYDVQFAVKTDPEDADKYNELLLANINPKSLADVHNYIDVLNFEQASIKADIRQNRTQIHLGYCMENAEDVWDDMTSSMADCYAEEYQAISFADGYIYTDIREDLNSGFIHIFQSIECTDIAIKDYISTDKEITLSNLGFMDFREEEANVSYKDDENGIGIYVCKEEWGKPEYEDEMNTVSFHKKTDSGFYVVKFNPYEEKFFIILDFDGQVVEYFYDTANDEYTNENGQDDVTVAIELAELLFEKPDTESILQDAWVTFDLYVKDTFNMDIYDLFELNYE